MPKFQPNQMIDITGQKFGHWTVIKRAPNRYGKSYFHCRCRCGHESVVGSQQLREGRSTNCGCWQGKLNRNRKFKTRWSVGENNILKHYYPKVGALPVAEMVGRSVESVRKRARKLNIKVEHFIYPRNDKWSDEEIEALKRLYPIGGLVLCRRYFSGSRTEHSVKWKAGDLGLTKAIKGKRGILNDEYKEAA